MVLGFLAYSHARWRLPDLGIEVQALRYWVFLIDLYISISACNLRSNSSIASSCGGMRVSRSVRCFGVWSWTKTPQLCRFMRDPWTVECLARWFWTDIEKDDCWKFQLVFTYHVLLSYPACHSQAITEEKRSTGRRRWRRWWQLFCHFVANVLI